MRAARALAGSLLGRLPGTTAPACGLRTACWLSQQALIDSWGLGSAPGPASAPATTTQPAHPGPGASYVRGATDVPLLEHTIGAALDRTAATHPDREALVSVHQAVRLTWREFKAHVDEVARGLLALGVQKRDRVGIWAPNSAEWVVLQYATAKVGAILVTVNPSYRAAELAHALRQSGVSLLVMAPELRGTSFPDLLESVADQVPALRHRVVLGADAPEGEGWSDWYDLRWAGEGAGLADALRKREATLHPSDPINLQFTSGTTGLPKGATLSHRNILNNGYLVGRGCDYTPRDRVCIPVPLFHCFGMVMGSLACTTHGATMVLPSECFDAEATLAAVEGEACTSLYGVPTMFVAALDHPRFRQYRLDSLRTGIMAGSTCPEELMRRVREDMHMADITICYGMTETSPVSFQTSTQDPVDRRVSTVGRIHPHLEAQVAAPGSSAPLPRGEVGELMVRGYSTMQGYWNDAAATAKCLGQDGWMRTGDLAMMDGQGYCQIVGRIKDMVIRGGENIYPREIEEFLHRHPAVADVQVFGVPDPKYGEELCCWFKLREGAPAVSPEELRAWCRGRISHFKVPRYWKLVTHYPTTASGKPQKYLMRQQAAAELGLADTAGPHAQSTAAAAAAAATIAAAAASTAPAPQGVAAAAAAVSAAA